MDVSLRGYLNELGFMEFHREDSDYYFVNIYRTNIIFIRFNSIRILFRIFS